MDYERGLRELKKLALGKDWYRDFLSLEAALRDRLRDEYLYGVAPQTHQELLRVIGQLNRLALEKLEISFNELCQRETTLGDADQREKQGGGGGVERKGETSLGQIVSKENTEEEGVVSIFYCYASEDKTFCHELEKQLVVMRRQKLLKSWYGQDIRAGDSQQEKVQKAFTSAQIVLLIVSPNLLSSDELYEQQIKPIYKRWQQKEVRVIPIILHHTEGWEETEFGGLASLPREKKPVSAWARQDEAFYTIAREIRVVVKEIREKQ